MKPMVFSLFANASLMQAIQDNGKYELGDLTVHQFPDDETYIKINSNVQGRKVIVITNLVQPNPKILPLIVLSETLRELGASETGLVAPYFPYMRQDKQFNSGEGVTARYFSKLISHYFTWLITIDPHLHRIHQLSEIVSIPNSVLHATRVIADWIKLHVKNPLIIGPDNESKQWIASIAEMISAPYVVAEKIRKGDSSVEMTMPQLGQFQEKSPVLIDDIISTGKTMQKAAEYLHAMKMSRPVCIGIHAVFVGGAYHELIKAPIEQVITCNTIEHSSNAINLNAILLSAMDLKIKD